MIHLSPSTADENNIGKVLIKIKWFHMAPQKILLNHPYYLRQEYDKK